MNWGVFTGLGHPRNMFLHEFCTRRAPLMFRYLCVVPKIPLGWYFLMVKYGNTTGFELSILICVGLSVVPMVEFTVEQLGNTNVVILLELHFQNPWSFI
jgi:hypothetical protein